MTMIRNYQMKTEFKAVANGRWGFAVNQASGEEVFIKEFIKYVYPDEEAMKTGNISFIQAKEECDTYKKRMEMINQKVGDVAGADGDVVVALDFFLDNNHLYKINRKITFMPWAANEIHEHLSIKQIDVMMQRLLYAISALHNAGIVHCDLKPDNIFIIEKNSTFVGMISDFDDSFFYSNIPHSEDIIGTPEYFSPEIGIYIAGDLDASSPIARKIGSSSDIFALGLIYHEYLTGNLPEFPDEYTFAYEAVVNDPNSLRLSSTLDPEHRELIASMLRRNPDERLKSCSQISLAISRFDASAKRHAKLSVAVIDEGKPIPNAQVHLLIRSAGSDNKKWISTTTTNARGLAVFTDFSCGDYWIVYNKAGQKYTWADNEDQYYTFNAAKPQRLDAGLQIRATVDGKTLAYVKVALYQNEGGTLQLINNAETDNQGIIKFDHLYAGKYIAIAGSKQTDILIESGSTKSIDLALTKERQLVVVITDQINKQPVTNVQVVLYCLESGNMTEIARATTDGNGYANFGFKKPGTYCASYASVPEGYSFSPNQYFSFTVTDGQGARIARLSLGHPYTGKQVDIEFNPPQGFVKHFRKIDNIFGCITLINDRNMIVKMNELGLYGLEDCKG